MTLENKDNGLLEFDVHCLLKSSTVTIRDTYCRGSCRHKSAEECTASTQLIFPYRGVYVRHVGQDQAVAEANQVLFFNGMEGYRVSHPVSGGDASLTLVMEESNLHELAPRDLLRDGPGVAFRRQHRRIDARSQALVALLRHSLRDQIAEPLEAETLALTLVQRALGPRTSRAAASTYGRQRLVDRVKLVLASDPARRWTLTEISAEVQGSPVYLTRVFQQVEGLPLYRYQLRLRLALLTAASARVMAYCISGEFGSKGEKVMAERTCAACDCKLEGDSIKVKIGGRTVEVCCDSCAQKLKEADASARATKRG